jgi:hypothetical protein
MRGAFQALFPLSTPTFNLHLWHNQAGEITGTVQRAKNLYLWHNGTFDGYNG